MIKKHNLEFYGNNPNELVTIPYKNLNIKVDDIDLSFVDIDVLLKK